jgi:hypothetical protein
VHARKDNDRCSVNAIEEPIWEPVLDERTSSSAMHDRERLGLCRHAMDGRLKGNQEFGP